MNTTNIIDRIEQIDYRNRLFDNVRDRCYEWANLHHIVYPEALFEEPLLKFRLAMMEVHSPIDEEQLKVAQQASKGYLNQIITYMDQIETQQRLYARLERAKQAGLEIPRGRGMTFMTVGDDRASIEELSIRF